MSTYTYETVTGVVNIEIAPEWQKILETADESETNANRRHTRPDHKYAPGEPLPLDSPGYKGERLVDRSDAIGDAELSADLECALRTLTDLQRRYFILSRVKGFSNAEIARLNGKDESTVREAIKAADKKIIKIIG